MEIPQPLKLVGPDSRDLHLPVPSRCHSTRSTAEWKSQRLGPSVRTCKTTSVIRLYRVQLELSSPYHVDSPRKTVCPQSLKGSGASVMSQKLKSQCRGLARLVATGGVVSLTGLALLSELSLPCGCDGEEVTGCPVSLCPSSQMPLAASWNKAINAGQIGLSLGQKCC